MPYTRLIPLVAWIAVLGLVVSAQESLKRRIFP